MIDRLGSSLLCYRSHFDCSHFSYNHVTDCGLVTVYSWTAFWRGSSDRATANVGSVCLSVCRHSQGVEPRLFQYKFSASRRAKPQVKSRRVWISPTDWNWPTLSRAVWQSINQYSWSNLYSSRDNLSPQAVATRQLKDV